MVRTDTTASHRTGFPDRAPHAAARGWRALVVTAVVVMGVAPALIVGVLLVVESAISNLRPKLAVRSRPPPPERWRAHALPLLEFSTACARLEPAPCAND